MMKPEERERRLAVLVVEMRLAGVPPQVVNYYRKYLWSRERTVELSNVYTSISMAKRGEDFSSWIRSFGHHFEDPDNLPVDESWRKKPRS